MLKIIPSLLLCVGVSLAHAGDKLKTYQVSITNLTAGQAFTPQLVFTHRNSQPIFTLGEAASNELEQLAEGGDTAPLSTLVADYANDVTTNGVLLMPGETTDLTIKGKPGRGRITVVAMLLPTNDTFVALEGMKLPRRGSVSYRVPAYDAGTEYNDQDCANIPGPLCGGEGYSPEVGDGDEGFVHIGNGFHDLGDDVLKPQLYDWNNDVAKITITRTH